MTTKDVCHDGAMTEPVYDRIGTGYAGQRRPDPRWQAAVDAALGRSRTVVNIGAGTGSYEPDDRYVLAVEPSTTMIRQRPAGSPPALQASAENLPIADAQFDVAMAIVSLHHWQDWAAGVREMLRVADRAVILHFDPTLHGEFWLARDYLPELTEIWRDVPAVDEVAATIGTNAVVQDLLIPWDCVDGFLPAYWRRPDAYLDPVVQQSMSGLQLLDPAVLSRGLSRLQSDLQDGTWQRTHAPLLHAEELDTGWRLIFNPEGGPRQ